jgi:PAS domain S-box-containing protein
MEGQNLIELLLVEDNPGDFRIIQELLRETHSLKVYNLNWVDRLSKGITHILQNPVDAVLLDLSLTDSSGLDTFTNLHSHVSRVPIIVMTGLDDEIVASKAVREGAQDYLVKGQTDSQLLERAIRYAIERKQAEEALRESESRYRHTLDDMLEGCQILDKDWRYLYINDAAEKQSRRPKNEIIGMSYKEIWPEMESTEVFSAMKICMEKGIPQTLENEIVFTDKSKGWYDFSIYPVPEGIVILSIDITERKNGETKLLEINSELEIRVRERTAELEEKNHELEAFTYSVSHDLKAPLRGMSGYSSLLLENYADRMDEDGRHYLEGIKKSTVKMEQLISDLLAYSRVEQSTFAARSVDLVLLIQNLLKERSEEMEKLGIEVKIDLHIKPVCADADGIAIVLRNLIDNAIKFSSKTTHPRIEIEGHDGEAECQLVIRDNGIGFDMQYSEEIFNIFKRLHRDDDYSGTGIGLAIVRKAIDRMGGKVWAESKPGEGASFFLEIPT